MANLDPNPGVVGDRERDNLSGYQPYVGQVNPSHAGPRNARIFVLAESPWKTEIARHQPLIGASGNLWGTWLEKVGLRRSEIRVENLYPFMPPSREIESVRPEELIPWIEDLHRRLAELPGDGPIVIVTMGNYATFALTGKGKVKAAIRNHFGEGFQSTATEAEKKAGITSLRGSIYRYIDGRGRQIKVIPTIHPAAILQNIGWERRTIQDWGRVAEEGRSRTWNVPERRHAINPSEWEVGKYVKFVEENQDYLELSVDIENWGNKLNCVGFALSPLESICVPTNSAQEKETFLPYIKRLCECRSAKILQNGYHDQYWLAWEGVRLNNFMWDTLCLKPDVEVLTQEGWLRLSSLDYGTRVMQWHESGKLSWTYPLHIHKFWFDGDLVKCKALKAPCSYTPEHRIPFLWQSSKKLCVKKAKEVAHLAAVYGINAGELKGRATDDGYSDAFIRLFVAVQADGHIFSSRFVYFQFKKERKIQRLQEIVEAVTIGVNLIELKSSRKGVRSFKLSGASVQHLLELDPKNFGPWMLSWSKREREIFISELKHWDGCITTGYDNFCSFNKENVKWVATIAHTIGKSAYVSKNGTNVNIKDKNYFSMRKGNFVGEKYSGSVYCLTVPSSFFLIRSEGQILVTGNCMHHALNPAESHSLEFLASIYTKEPYWKDEAKEAEEIVKYATSLEALYTYNGKDCCVTYEVKTALKRELEENGMLDFYLRHYRDMFNPLMATMLHGVRVDVGAQKAWAKRLGEDMKGIRKELDEAAGENLFATERKTAFREPTSDEWDLLLTKEYLGAEDFASGGAPKGKLIDKEARQKLIDERELTYMIGGANAGLMRYWKEIDKKTFSPIKLKDFFYGKLGLPEQKKYRKGKKEKTVALDEDAIRKLNQKFPAKIGNYGNLLLIYREKKREQEYMRGAWDKDGRIRCAYKMTTEAGRLASSGNPKGKGYNLQNIKR